MIGTTPTLSRYISRQFLLHFLAALLILAGIMYLFDVVELLRRASGKAQAGVTASDLLSMAFMHLPYLLQKVLPMGALFAAIYTCWKLNKTSELIVIRSFGLSAWQFLSPLLLCAALIGAVATAALNPVSAIFLARYNEMNAQYFLGARDLVTVSKTGIWLRQPEANGNGYALIHSATVDKSAWKLNNVIVLFFDSADNFLKRADSPEASLRPGHWEISQPIINDKNGSARLDLQILPTELTPQKIEESFADPEIISFWNIPEYINIMEDTGFPATSLYLQFHTLLAQPFLLAAMVLLAAAFSMRPPRFGGVASMIALGVSAGFLVFFTQSVLQAFGLSQKIPVALAAWAPPALTLLVGVSALLHTEDG